MVAAAAIICIPSSLSKVATHTHTAKFPFIWKEIKLNCATTLLFREQQFFSLVLLLALQWIPLRLSLSLAFFFSTYLLYCRRLKFHRRNICMPTSCGSSNCCINSLGATFSSVSFPLLTRPQCQGPSWGRWSFRPPNSSIATGGCKIGWPEKKEEKIQEELTVGI